MSDVLETLLVQAIGPSLLLEWFHNGMILTTCVAVAIRCIPRCCAMNRVIATLLKEVVRHCLANSRKVTQESQSLMVVRKIGTCGGQASFSTERISRHCLENLQTAILKSAAAKFGTGSPHSYGVLSELSAGRFCDSKEPNSPCPANSYGAKTCVSESRVSAAQVLKS